MPNFISQIYLLLSIRNSYRLIWVKAGKLLYENDNTDWVDQMASISPDYQKRIVKLIDLHLGKLGKDEMNQALSGDLEEFDIGEYC